MFTMLNGNEFDGEQHVFRTVEGTFQIKIRDIHGDMVGVIITDHGVEKALDGGGVDRGATTITIVVREIATDGETYAQDIRAPRLRLAGSDNGGVHGRAATGYTWDNVHGFRGENEAMEFIKESLLPTRSVLGRVKLRGVAAGAGQQRCGWWWRKS